MKKSQCALFLGIEASTIIVVILLYCSLSRSSKLGFKEIFFSMVLLFFFTCLCVNVAHFIAYKRGMQIMYEMLPGKKDFYYVRSQDNLAAAAKAIRERGRVRLEKGFFIFIPLIAEELGSILIDDIELKYREDLDEGCVVIKENQGLLPSRVTEYGVDLSKCVVLFNISELDKIEAPGLYVFVRWGGDLRSVVNKCSAFSLKNLKIEKKGVLLTYEACKPVKDAEGLRWLLLDSMPGCDDVSIGEALIRKFLMDCPNDESDMELWINKSYGQMAITVLSMLHPVDLLNGNRFRETRESAFNKQFIYLVDYVQQKRVTVNKEDVEMILRFIRCNNFLDEEVFVSRSYKDLNDNFSVNVRLTLENIINSSGIWDLYIAAVASCCPYGVDDCVKINSCIEEFCEPMKIWFSLDEIQNQVLANWDQPIISDTGSYDELRIDRMLKEMLKEGIIEETGNKEYTGKQLNEFARLLIAKKCHDEMAILCKVPNIYVGQIKSPIRIVLANRQTSQVTSSVGIDSVVSSNIVGAQSKVL